MTTTNTRFTRRTLAIALAAGMSLGAVTVSPTGTLLAASTAHAQEKETRIGALVYRDSKQINPDQISGAGYNPVGEGDSVLDSDMNSPAVVYLGKGQSVLSDGSIKTPNGVWKRTDVNKLGVPQIQLKFNQTTPGYMSQQEVAQNVIKYVPAGGDTTLLMLSPANYPPQMFTAYVDSLQKTPSIDVSNIVFPGAEVMFTDDAGAAYRPRVNPSDPHGKWRYDKTRGTIEFDWNTSATAPITDTKGVIVTFNGTDIYAFYVKAFGPKAKLSSVKTQMKWSEDGGRAESAHIYTGLEEQFYGKDGKATESQQRNLIAAFPPDGQPSGAVMEGNEEGFVANFPLSERIAKNSRGYSNYMTVPGEGAWYIGLDDDRETKKYKYMLTFVPEEGFKGKPSPVKYTFVDSGLINDATQIHGLSTPVVEDSEGTSYPPELGELYDRFIFEPREVVVDKFVGPNETPSYENIDDGSADAGNDIQDLHVTDVKKDKDGNYVVTRNDGEKWTINLKDLRDKIDALEKKNSPTRDEYDKLAGELKEAKDGIDGLKGKDAEIDAALEELKNGLGGLDGRVSKLEGRVTAVENATIKEVVKNNDGTYTLVRKDGTKVKGNIGDPKEIKDITPNADGSITITRVNGTEDKVKLAHTKVTEANKGKTNHTITITTPGGKPLTFNVFDRHVNNVAKQGRGKYVVKRNDGASWTIDYSDLYTTADDLTKKVADHEKRIKALEANDKVQDKKIEDLRADVDKHTKELERVNTEIREITKTIETNSSHSDEKFKEVNKRIDKVRNDLGLLDVRVTNLEGRMALVEGRLDVVEDVQDKWAKCYSGTGIAALPIALSIPLYVLSQTHIPQVEALNADIQKRIGIFNPELAAMWRQNGGILQVTAALAGLAGTIGAIAYAANECKPYSETDAASKTPLGQMSSKVYAGSSRDESAEESAAPAK